MALPLKIGTILSIASQLARTAFFVVIERLVPAQSNLWCFCTWPGAYPHTIDNPRAVFEEVKDDPSIVKVVLLRDGDRPTASLPREGRNVVFVHAESLRGAYLLARARVVLLGYALGVMTSYSRHLTRKHLIVQLWHGIPLKRIGRLFPDERWWPRETFKYAATVSSAERDRDIMAAAFAPLPTERVWLTGLPRNDLLLKAEEALPGDYGQMLDDLRQRLAGRRLVLYAPTWRERADGLYDFSDDELRALVATLSANGAVLGIRGHANRRNQDPTRFTDRGILLLNDLPDVNLILRLTDVLITDYSSIYIDFLLTGRPILHFTYDLRSYVAERGFLYEIEDALAGPAHESFAALLAGLRAALGPADGQDPRYAAARTLFHSHDGQAARRVADEIARLAGQPLTFRARTGAA